MNVLEGYGAALFRLSQTVDPVVLIWTSTFALALAYFFIAKLVEPLFPTQQNTRSSPGAPGAAAQGIAGEGSRGVSTDGISLTKQNSGSREVTEEFWSRVEPEVRSLHEGFRRKVLAAAGEGRKAALFGGRITISTCGVLFQEDECHQLKRCATLVPHARDLVEALSYFGRVYLVTQVLDDRSQENAVRSLREGGICGTLVEDHHCLFCEKHVSKVSIARQVEPCVHVDAERATASELQRFLPRVLLVSKMAGAADPSKPNMLHAETLHSFCSS